MSGEPEDKLSPEERLLKVIQGKDSAGVEPTKPDVPAASALTQTSSDVVTPAQAPPRLRTKPLKRQAAKPRKPAATPIVIPAVPNPAPTEPPSVESNSVPALEPSSPPSPVFGDDSPAEAPVVFADMRAEPPVIDEEPEEVPPSKGPRQFGISIVNTSIAALLMFTIVVIIAYELVAAFQSSDQAGIGLTPGSLPPVEEVGERFIHCAHAGFSAGLHGGLQLIQFALPDQVGGGGCVDENFKCGHQAGTFFTRDELL